MSFGFCRPPRRWCFGAAALAVTATLATAQPSSTRPREFPPGALKQFEELPSGRFRAQIDRLPQAARQRALHWMQGFHFTELDLEALHADSEGGIYYVDIFPSTLRSAAGTLEEGQSTLSQLQHPPPTHRATEDGSDPAPAEAETPEVGEAAVPVSPFPASLVFHSKPGAPNVLFLNFCGEAVSGTVWNNSLGRTNLPTVAFSSDTDFSTFSDAEQLVIKRVWQRVAEDFAPFNLDVTTERPATFTSRTAHALITRNTDANGDPNPSSSAGGVAYVNVFGGSSYANYRPAWIYYNNLGSSEANIAEATSHEIGHNLGLSHDGKTDGTTYYGGHGSGDISWGPLMGTGYNRNLSQWSKGDYYLANNTEDDLAVIAGKVTYRTDDHGNTRAAATPLTLTGGTNVVSTTPETDPTHSNPANKGVLERSTDVDVFSFVTGSGPISLTVNPWIMPAGTRGGNLDVSLELYDESGVLVLANNVSNRTYASLQTTLTEGLYFLQIRNTGVGDPLAATPVGYTAYASLGQYFISGYVRTSGYVAPPQAELQATDLTQPGTAAKPFMVTYTDNVAMDVSTIDNSDLRVTGPNGYDRAAQFVSLDTPSDGTPRVATYTAEAPAGGVWTHDDDGIYTVTLRTNQVGDTEGSWVTGQQLGQFRVSVPLVLYSDNLDVNSGWTLQPQWQYGTPTDPNGPSGGFTGTKIIGYNLSGDYANNLATVYATSPIIDCSGAHSLTLRFQRWLRLRNNDTAVIEVSTNGSSWMTVWSTSSSVQDDSWRQIQYPLPASVAGSSTVRLRLGLASNTSQTDIGWNIDDLEIFGQSGNPPPQFVLTASANNPTWGTVTPSSGTYPSGSTVDVTARSATYFRFKQWTGDAAGTNNPVTVTLTSNRSVQAGFEEMLTANYPTPHWWLASYGYTQNLESAVTHLGSNGVALWQSYLAGLNPNDPGSQVRLFVARGSGNNLVLHWNAVTGRVYTVWSSTNGMNAFAPISSAANLPCTITAITNGPIHSSPMTLYRLEVRKP